MNLSDKRKAIVEELGRQHEIQFVKEFMLWSEHGWWLKQLNQALTDYTKSIAEIVKFEPLSIDDADQKFINGYNACVEAWKIYIRQLLEELNK